MEIYCNRCCRRLNNEYTARIYTVHWNDIIGTEMESDMTLCMNCFNEYIDWFNYKVGVNYDGGLKKKKEEMENEALLR